MKNCFVVMILFVGLAFSGNSITAPVYNPVNKDFKYRLQQYIKDQKSNARTAYNASWIPGVTSALDYASKWCKKGTSVDMNEIELLTKISDADYEKAIAQQDILKVEMLAEEIFQKIKYEKDVNKWHDEVYDLISQYNDPGMSRKEAIKRKLARKDDPTIQQQFVFGIAVTMTVEEMMSLKK